MTAISMRNLSKYFDGGETVANYQLNLDIADGEFFVLLGPSGCGKTTALRLIAGLETPSEGTLHFDDDRVDPRSPSDRNVAMVFQNYALYPHMTVRENIAYPLKMQGISSDERDDRIMEMAEMVEIDALLEKSPAELSGGQRQRTSLARAIVREPSVFLLDEPLSNLDKQLRLRMRSELDRLQEQLGVTTVYVTHNQEEAMSLGDRIAVMKAGTIRQVAEPQTLYDRPRTSWVARFIGSPPMNVIEGTQRNGTVDIVPGNTVRMQTGVESDTVSLGIRPEDLSVSTEKPEGDRVIQGNVDTVEPLGEFTVVNVAVGEEFLKVKEADASVEMGDQVFLSFDEERVQTFDGDGHLVRNR